MHSGGDAGEEVAFGGKEAAAVTEEGEAGASGKGATSEADPGEDAHPVDLTADGGEGYEEEGESAGNWESGVNAPAGAGDITDEEIRKPDGDGGRADVHEESEGQNVAGEREMPGTAAQELLYFDDEDGEDEPGDEERHRAADFVRRRLLEKSQDGKKNDNGARIRDLPLEMVAIDLILAHEREGSRWEVV